MSDVETQRGADVRTSATHARKRQKRSRIGRSLVAGLLTCVLLGAVSVLVAAEVGVFSDAASSGVSPAPGDTSPPPSSTPQAPGRAIPTPGDLSDPFMMTWLGRHYLYTGEGSGYVPVAARVEKAGHWGPEISVLPQLPPWAGGLMTWAPDVYRVSGGWALYFSSLVEGAPYMTHCIGSAFSTSPLGPFVASPRPFICQLDHRGSIDARVIADGDRLVMLWKSEDNADPTTPEPAPAGPTGIYAQYLSADGRALVGKRVKIFHPAQPWEGPIVESPDMVEVGGTYWLFFSANWYNTPDYGIGVAACKTPFGPCADTSTKALLGSNLQGQGPGEESLYTDQSGVYLLYNPFKASHPGLDVPRPAMMARLGFTPKGPYLATP